MEYNNKRKRKDNIIYYKCDLCSHLTTNKNSFNIHTKSIKHLLNNYEKHKNHETDIDDYIGLLMNQKIDEWDIDEKMRDDIKNFNIKSFEFDKFEEFEEFDEDELGDFEFKLN